MRGAIEPVNTLYFVVKQPFSDMMSIELCDLIECARRDSDPFKMTKWYMVCVSYPVLLTFYWPFPYLAMY